MALSCVTMEMRSGRRCPDVPSGQLVCITFLSRPFHQLPAPMVHSVRLSHETQRYWVQIPAGSDVCHRGFAYKVLESVNRHGVCSAVCTVRAEQEQSRAEQSRAGQSKAEQDRAGQSKTEQGRAGQSRKEKRIWSELNKQSMAAQAEQMRPLVSVTFLSQGDDLLTRTYFETVLCKAKTNLLST